MDMSIEIIILRINNIMNYDMFNDMNVKNQFSVKLYFFEYL